MFRIRSDNPFASAEWDGVLGLAQDRILERLESRGELEEGWAVHNLNILKQFLVDVSGSC